MGKIGLELKFNTQVEDFPGVPAVGTPNFQSRGSGLIPCPGGQDPIYTLSEKGKQYNNNMVEFGSVERGGIAFMPEGNCMNKVQRWEQVYSCHWEETGWSKASPLARLGFNIQKAIRIITNSLHTGSSLSAYKVTRITPRPHHAIKFFQFKT